jgi:hypothetical protein
MLEGVRRVIIGDYTNYVPELSCNGGRYAYYTIFERVGEDEWTVKYETTAEFSYCSIDGQFQDCTLCSDYDPEEGCRREPTVVDTSYVLEIIREYEHDPEHEIKYVVEDEDTS